uniref:Uncharacterized protein n=1 Tax=Loa loa TaxID=7209 RepID=A0A1I7VYC3_LOALO
MGGKPLKSLLCCYHPKAKNIRNELRSISGYHNQTYIKQINSKQNADLSETDKKIATINEKCTYKRNESPQPVEITNLKLNGAKVSLFQVLA